MRTALLWVITQRVVTISYRRFGTIYQSHLQWWSQKWAGCSNTEFLLEECGRWKVSVAVVSANRVDASGWMEGSVVYWENRLSFGFFSLKMGPIGCPETSVKNATTRCVITQNSAVLIYFAAKPEITQIRINFILKYILNVGCHLFTIFLLGLSFCFIFVRSLGKFHIQRWMKKQHWRINTQERENEWLLSSFRHCPLRNG
jgi:hypothetical protein